jgi:HEAT repeat protein
MWRLSESTQELVRQLYELEKKSSWFALSNKYEQTCALLDRLANTGEPGAVAFAARFLFSWSSAVRQAARKAITVLISLVSPYDLLHGNDAFGWSYGWYVSDRWDRLSPNTVEELAGEPGQRLNSAVLGLLTFHRNGYVRQEAVRLLATIADGTELSFLLIRQNDWVRQVAHEAQVAVDERVSENYLPHIVKSRRLILHLATYSRYDHRSIVERTIQLLLHDENDDILRSCMRSSDRTVRRHVVRIGLATPGHHQIRLVRHCLASEDPIVRLSGCRYLARIDDPDLLRNLVRQVRSDPSMPVRREALRIWAERFPLEANEVWQKALLDRSFSIREVARFSLSKLGEFNRTAFYREQVLEHPALIPAIEGLAETAETDDIPFLRSLLNHRYPSRRLIAVYGLARIKDESVTPDLVRCLRDDNPKIVRAARALLQPHTYSMNGDELLHIAIEASQEYSRHNAIAMIADMGKWRSLPWLIRATSAENSDVSNFAAQEIVAWLSPPKCNRVFTRPSESEFREIQEAFATTGESLPKNVRTIIEAHLHR